MADNKKSIVVYADWIDNFESLSDEEAGRLIKHFFKYVNDLNPIPVDRITEISFIPLKNTLKRDLKKWETKLEERSVSGRMGNLKRWNSDLHVKVESKEITLNQAETIAIDRKTSLSDKNITVANENIANIAVSDSVSVTVSDINKSLLSEIKISDVEDCILPYFKTAKEFQRLFIENLKEKEASTVHQEKAKFGSYVNPIRLIIENKEGTLDDLRDIFKYLKSPEGEFWKSNILSTVKLREQLPKLIMNARQLKQNNKHQKIDKL